MADYTYYYRLEPLKMPNKKYVQLILRSEHDMGDDFHNYYISIRTDDISLRLNSSNSQVTFRIDYGGWDETITTKLRSTTINNTIITPTYYNPDGTAKSYCFNVFTMGSSVSVANFSLMINGVTIGSNIAIGTGIYGAESDKPKNILGYGSTSTLDSVILPSASSINLSSIAPIKTGFVFSGWRNNVNSSIYQLGQSIPGSLISNVSSPALVLEPTFSVATYTITFDSQGGSAIASKQVQYNTAVGTLYASTRAHYVFGGWYTSPNGGGSQVLASTIVTANDTYYAKWTAETYYVIFDSEGGTPATSTRQVVYNNAVGIFPPVSRDGYELLGWYTEPDGGGTPISYTTIITADIMIYAYWRKLEVTVTFDAQGGIIPDPVTLEPGDTLSTIPSSFKEGYVLLGWYDNLEYTGDPLSLDTIIDNNVTYYAQWEEYVVPSRVYVLHDGIYREGIVYIKDNDVYVESDIYIKDGIYKRGVRKE